MYVTDMLESGEMPRDYGFEQGKASIQKKMCRREEWEMRQKETEAKFLELSSLSEKLAAIPRVGLPFEKAVGMHLGTGDYGHLVIDHSAMLLRYFRSFYKYSGQGFEASHKLHRSLYSKATSHDSSGPGHS
ncbi:hypothetical protein pdam_00025354 [Pocillopora damicornis]|uniref:Uncharacterized protein n=1 Tax=Pocillopora damicornis TaxID=46731 RepID=A0A3M6T4M1_POCDA|nr:hypothetical protein pdam_00025354 [Pocillopora damicornis]